MLPQNGACCGVGRPKSNADSAEDLVNFFKRGEGIVGVTQAAWEKGVWVQSLSSKKMSHKRARQGKNGSNSSTSTADLR